MAFRNANMNAEPEITRNIFALLIPGVYGTFGALVHYLYGLVRDENKKFRFGLFIVNGILGFFIGQVVGSFIPPDFVYRDGTLLLAGFLVFQILAFIEARGLGIALNRIFGTPIGDDNK